MSEPVFVPLPDRHEPGVPPEQAAREFHELMAKRRTVREYSDRPVTRETIEWIVRAAGTAPSGANKQPWRFVCVRDPELKHEIRVGAGKQPGQHLDDRDGAPQRRVSQEPRPALGGGERPAHRGVSADLQPRGLEVLSDLDVSVDDECVL